MLAALSQIVSRQEIVKSIEITSRFHLSARKKSAFYLFNDILNLTSHSHDGALILTS